MQGFVPGGRAPISSARRNITFHGDAFTWAGVEECDDGNDVNTDACVDSCVAASCGDGFPGPGEGCDDGDEIEDDECTNACAAPMCGDGIVHAGEACDDWGADAVSVLHGNGDGTFGERLVFGVGTEPWTVAVGDLDGDATLDIVAANEASNDVTVLLGVP